MIFVLIIYSFIYFYLPHNLEVGGNFFMTTFFRNKFVQILLLSFPFREIFKFFAKSDKKIILKTVFYILFFFLVGSQIYLTIAGLPQNVSVDFMKHFNYFYIQTALMFLYAFIFYLKTLNLSGTMDIKQTLFKSRYSVYIWLSIALVINFLLKVYLANHHSPDTDEIYTWTVIKGFEIYGKIGMTPSGETIEQTPIFHYISYYFYAFFKGLGFSELLSLRSFNIIFSTILPIPAFLLLKKLVGQKISFFTILLLIFNWYFLMIQITARTYVTFVYFSFFSIACLYFASEHLFQKNYKKGIFLFLLSLVFGLFNFFEGHIIGFYHYIFFTGILILFNFSKFNVKKRYYFIGGFLVMIFLFYLYFFRHSYIDFILNTFQPFFQSHVILQIGSILNNLGVVGNAFILLSLYLGFKYGNYYFKLVVVYFLFSYLFHSYFFSSKLYFFKYLTDLFFLILPVIIYALMFVVQKKRFVGYILLLLFLFSDGLNIYKISQNQLSWILDYKEDRDVDFNYCAKNEYNNVLTDNPHVASFYRDLYSRDNDIYMLKPYGQTGYDYIFKDGKFRYRFLNIPVVESLSTFNDVYAKGKICMVLTHNVYDEVNRFGNEELFEYVMKYGKHIKDTKLIQNIYDLSYFDYSPNNHNGTLIVFDK